MAFVNWSDSYSVGIHSIDDQHKKLIGLINDLSEAMQARKANQELGKIINALFDYSQTHFSYEEDFFDQFGYEDKIAHIIKHREFISKLADFKMDFQSGKLMVSIKVMDFLREWLIDHIQGSDKKYGPFLNEKGVK